MSVLQVTTQLAFWCPIVLFSIGFPAALFNAIIFISVKTFRQSPTIYYVVGQSLADMSVLLLLLLQIIPSTSTSVSSMACKLMLFFTQFTVGSAMSLLCLAAFDRWACTSQSARVRQLSSNHIACRLCLLSFLFWSLVSIPLLIFCDLIPPTFVCWYTNNLFAQIVNYFLFPILSYILPLLVLITFGMLTYRNIRLVTHIRRQPAQTRLSMWEQQMTRMMLTQTLLSVSCTFPRAIFFIYSIATIGDLTTNVDQLFIELLINQLTIFINGMNFVSSFYIYLLCSPRLRQTIKIYLKRLLNLPPNQIGPTNISLTGRSPTA